MQILHSGHTHKHTHSAALVENESKPAVDPIATSGKSGPQISKHRKRRDQRIARLRTNESNANLINGKVRRPFCWTEKRADEVKRCASTIGQFVKLLVG